MHELKQDIFPICSFGRAENVFYQSSDSLCPRELTLNEILLLIKDHPAPIFPSHILDREDWESLLVEIKAMGVKPRVQAALGREWEELSRRLVLADHLGWGVDILVDRPLTMLVMPAEVSALQDVRWIVCPLRFFNLRDIGQSLVSQNVQEPILWCFLEPRDDHTLLLNPDEVILAKKELDGISSLILRSSLNSKSGFYQSPTLEVYQENFVALGANKKVRGLVASRLKDFPQIFSMVIFLISLLKVGKIKWLFVRWGWAIRSVAIRLYWRAREFFTVVYWRIYGIGSTIFWWLRGRPFYLLSWPFRKVYWFVKYQYETRIYPVVKGLLTDD